MRNFKLPVRTSRFAGVMPLPVSIMISTGPASPVENLLVNLLVMDAFWAGWCMSALGHLGGITTPSSSVIWMLHWLAFASLALST